MGTPGGGQHQIVEWPGKGQYRHGFGRLDLSSAPVAYPLQQVVVTVISCGLVAVGGLMRWLRSGRGAA
jgi:hypothetical protein